MSELRRQIYWLSWPINQWILRLFAHHLWQGRPAIERLLLTLFLRIGDTKGVEESHKIGRAMEKRDQQRDVLNLLAFYSKLQGENTPLHDRGIQNLGTLPSGAYQPAVDSKPPVPWSKACGTGSVVPPPFGLQSVWGRAFESRTPQSGRASITVAQALVHVYRQGCLDKAGVMWHAVALMPHTLVRCAHSVFLIVAQARYAARAWPATVISPPPSTSGCSAPTRWGFDIECSLVWLFIEDIVEWHAIEVAWVSNNVETESFGFVVAEEIGPTGSPHVPVLAEAMIIRGKRKLIKADRKAFCALEPPRSEEGPSPPIGLGGGLHAEIFLLQRLMEGHPRLDEYLGKLEKYHKLAAIKATKRAKTPGHAADVEHSEASVSSSSSEDEGKNAALSFAALDGMDDCNSKEWKKEHKFHKLMGMEGVQRMARRIVREERESSYKHQAHGTPRRKQEQKVRLKCKEGWTRCYVPGAPESGVEAPAGTSHSGLTCPPGRSCWVGQLRHPSLQASGKRPTRSKTFYASVESGGASEHEAFQLVLKWLWDRFEACFKLATPSASGELPSRPPWVLRALQPCAFCSDKEPCSFMQSLRAECGARAKVCGGVGSDESSMWEAAGSSDSQSSAADQPPPGHTSSKARKGAPSGPEVAHSASELGVRAQVLLVGDSNAVGYCETHPVSASLRRALGEYFDVILAAKSNTSWSKISGDAHTELQAYAKSCKGKSDAPIDLRGRFDAVVTVLGTNDVPKVSALPRTWTRLEDLVPPTLEKLKVYLKPEAEPEAIIVTQPFNFEADRAANLFNELLAKSAKSTCVRFEFVPWDIEVHCQSAKKNKVRAEALQRGRCQAFIQSSGGSCAKSHQGFLQV